MVMLLFGMISMSVAEEIYDNDDGEINFRKTSNFFLVKSRIFFWLKRRNFLSKMKSL